MTLHQLICSHCGTRTYEADDHRFGLDFDFLRDRQDLGKLEGAVEAILKKHRVDGLLEVCYAKEVEKRAVRQYKDRPARTEERIRYVSHV